MTIRRLGKGAIHGPGNRRFEEFQAYTEATPQMVAARLKKLEADGLVKRRVYNRRPLRRECI